MDKITLEKVGPGNLSDCGIGCLTSPKYQGLHIVYSAQCPMLPKSVNDLSELAAEHGLELKVTVLNNAHEAQNAPSYYGVFSLVWNGRLLSDHYVSKGRFKNLLRKEILKERDRNGRQGGLRQAAGWAAVCQGCQSSRRERRKGGS